MLIGTELVPTKEKLELRFLLMVDVTLYLIDQKSEFKYVWQIR